MNLTKILLLNFTASITGETSNATALDQDEEPWDGECPCGILSWQATGTIDQLEKVLLI